MELKRKKVLVTGGAGFIGSNTVKALVDMGADVIVVDNLSTGCRENLIDGVRFYEINIADPKLEQIFEKEKPEIIYHFAFNVLVPESVKNPLLDMDSIVGSVNLFQNAKNYGSKKVIFASSGFTYGNNPNLPLRETEPLEPVSPYAISKGAVENYLIYFGNAYKIPYVIFRYATVYGPGQIKGAMADYIRKLSDGKQAEIWGDGNKTRDYIYIDDIVSANILALDLPDDFPNPIFNLGAGRENTLNELYLMIAKLLEKDSRPIYLPDRPGEQYRFLLDTAKAQKHLKWIPRYSLEEGLRMRLKNEKMI